MVKYEHWKYSRVFHSYTKLAVLASNDLTTAKIVTSIGVQLDARNYY